VDRKLPELPNHVQFDSNAEVDICCRLCRGSFRTAIMLRTLHRRTVTDPATLATQRTFDIDDAVRGGAGTLVCRLGTAKPCRLGCSFLQLRPQTRESIVAKARGISGEWELLRCECKLTIPAASSVGSVHVTRLRQPGSPPTQPRACTGGILDCGRTCPNRAGCQDVSNVVA